MAVIQFNPNAHGGTNTVTVVGTHQLVESGTADSHVIQQNGVTVVTLTDEGRDEYLSKAPMIARGDYVTISG